MRLYSLTLKEILYRKGMFLVSIIFIAIAISSLVAFENIDFASKDQVRKFMKDMGTNITILPANINLSNYWAGEYEDIFMPEDYLKRVAGIPKIEARHFIAKLQQMIMINNNKFYLTGLLPEIGPADREKKKSMSPSIKMDEAILGYEAAKKINSVQNDTIIILGKSFRVINVNASQGTIDDIRIYINLKDAQEILQKPNLINAIDALGCICFGDFSTIIKKQITGELPDTQVVIYRSIAVARTKTRMLIAKLGFYLQLLLFSIAGIVVLLYFFTNVWDRREEIAILRAIGFCFSKISFIFVFKFILIGILGGVLGFILGSVSGIYLGKSLLDAKVLINMHMLWISVGYALLIIIFAGIIPIIKISQIDPARILRTK